MTETEPDTCTCGVSRSEAGDFFTDFDFDKGSLDYYDGPHSGWLSCKKCRRWFAFECFAIVEGCLWHWTMVPGALGDDPHVTIRDAAKNPGGWWLSVVEDLRTGAHRDSAVRLPNVLAPVVEPPQR